MSKNALENSFEFINVKKAQYNREVKNAKAKTAVRRSSTPVRNRAGSRSGYSTPRNYYGNSAAAVRENGIGMSELVGAVGEQIGDALIEKRRERLREKSNQPIVIRKHVKAKAFPVAFVFYALIMTITFMFIAYNYSVTNDISYETSKLESEIKLEKQEKERLSLALEKRNDLAYIEDIAANKLGMVKSTDIVKRYVSLSGTDKVLVSDKAHDVAYLGTTLNGFKNTVSKIFE